MSRLKKDAWCIAIRKRTDGLLLKDESAPFKRLPNSLRYWCADPFLFEHEGRKYLFFEAYDRLKRKGVLGYRILYPNGKYSKIRKCYERDTHLSYPHIFYGRDGKIYMLPENNKSGYLYLLRAVRFPDGWEEIPLAQGAALVDSTLLFKGKKTYLFTTRMDKDNVSRLELYTLSEKGELLPAAENPVLENKLGGRMAGNLFIYEGKQIRVAQDCRTGYGGGLAFFEVLCLDGKYEEKLVKEIPPERLPVKAGKYRLGCHTYNFDEEWEVVDLKGKSVNLIEWLGYLIGRFKR